MKKIFFSLVVLGLVGCSNKSCREIRQEASAGAPPVAVSKEKDPMSKTAIADRVKVHKADGSLQCSQGKAISLLEMQKQLGDIQVHKSYNQNDGMMRIQVCGAATGNSNIYEIDRKDLAAAIKAGFKEWTVN